MSNGAGSHFSLLTSSGNYRIGATGYGPTHFSITGLIWWAKKAFE